uniref:7TM_GPCR_Srx domain-containing protein n=1 Tax=Steinernema glaseri TaxID=37863 RepID=A0A1I7YUM6_9BILA
MGHEHHVFEDVEAYMKYLKLFVQYADLVLAAFIIFLSVKYVRQSLIRTYTVNICVAGLIVSVYKVTRDNIDPLLEPLLPDSNKLGNLIDSLFHVSMLFPALVLHEVQGTLLIVMTYLVFSKPLKYRDVFSKRNVRISFILGNIFSVILALAMYIEEVSILHTLKVIQIHDMVRFVLECSMIAVMFTFYFKTLYVLVFKKEVSTKASSETYRRNRDSLRAVLIYCTPPNVFLVLGVSKS